MGMTHYMELMMGSWQLLVLFMAVPMFLAECYVVSEVLLLLEGQKASTGLRKFNKFSAWASAIVIFLLAIAAGKEFLAVTEWRGWVDESASIAYVLAGLPFIVVALIEGGLLMRHSDAIARGKTCVGAVVAYLILAHAAMVFGMIDPMQFGWQPTSGSMNGHMNHDMSSMGAMDHSKMNHAQMHHNMHGMHQMPDGSMMPNDAMSGDCPHMAAMGHAESVQKAALPQQEKLDELIPAMPAGEHCGHDAMPEILKEIDEHEGSQTTPPAHPHAMHQMPDGSMMRNDAMEGGCPHLAAMQKMEAEQKANASMALPENSPVPSASQHHCE